MEVVARLRSMFDLDARPEVIHGHLRGDALLRPLLAAHRGLRLPGAFDGFELAVRAILGQQISVAGATTLSGRLVERFGAVLPGGRPGVDRLFPSAERLAELSLAEIRAIGLPEARARTILGLAAAVASGAVDLGAAARSRGSADRASETARCRALDGPLRRDARAALARWIPGRGPGHPARTSRHDLAPGGGAGEALATLARVRRDASLEHGHPA